MNEEQKALEIFNLFWLSYKNTTRKASIKYSLIYIEGIIRTFKSLPPTAENNEMIKYYEKVKIVVEDYEKMPK